jgi:hypothetical protein
MCVRSPPAGRCSRSSYANVTVKKYGCAFRYALRLSCSASSSTKAIKTPFTCFGGSSASRSRSTPAEPVKNSQINASRARTLLLRRAEGHGGAGAEQDEKERKTPRQRGFSVNRSMLERCSFMGFKELDITKSAQIELLR